MHTKLALLFFALAGTGTHASGTLSVYNWSDYIARDTLPAFQKATGVSVRYEVYDSNEVLQGKLLTGRSGYDIVVPTNTFLAKQIDAGLYQPIDKRKLSHYKQLDPMLLKLLSEVDPGNRYAVPYFWGVNTLAVNVDQVDKALAGKLPAKQWDLLFKPDVVARLKDCGVSIPDSPSEVFPLALRYLGKDPASKNEADYLAAAQLLKQIRPYITRFSSSGYINELSSGSLCLALGFGGDLNIARKRALEAKKGVRIQPLVPEQGVGIWIDAMAIPVESKNAENAHKFIEHNLQPQVAAANANYVNYAPGSLEARRFVSKENLANPSIFPGPAVMANSFIMRPIDPKVQRISNRLWGEIKAGK